MGIPTISRGIPPGGHAAAARLYWEASLATVDSGTIVGVLGFHLHDTQAIAVSHADLRTHYAPWSAWWRLALLAPLDRRPRPGELLLDGVCVAAPARGTGIGTRLLHEAVALAPTEGATSVRLSVVDTNPRARALYERLGFHATSTEHMGSLGPRYGFTAATQMVRPVDLDTPPP